MVHLWQSSGYCKGEPRMKRNKLVEPSHFLPSKMNSGPPNLSLGPGITIEEKRPKVC